MTLRPAVCALVALLLLPVAAIANWTPAGLSLAGSYNQFYGRIISDGSGGLLVWRFSYNNSFGYWLNADRVNALGNLYPNWDANPQFDCRNGVWAVGDDLGGLYEVWRPTQSLTPGVYLRRILGPGGLDPAWPANGLAVSTPGVNTRAATVVEDGANGAFVAYTEDPWFRVKRVLPSGTFAPGWPAGGRVLDTNASFWNSRGVPDGSGGAYVFWFNSADELKVQRVTATSAFAPDWPSSGIVLDYMTATWDFGILEVIPGPDHLLVAWFEKANGGPQWVKLMKIGLDGWPLSDWPVMATPVSGINDWAKPHVVGDGNGGAWIAWNTAAGARGSHVRADAVKDLDNIALLPPGDTSNGPVALANGPAGGLVVVWPEGSGFGGPLRARWLLADGTADPSQPAAGRLVDSENCSALHARPDGSGGAYVLWNRYNTSGQRIAWLPYPQQSVSVPETGGRVTARLQMSPNPARTELSAWFTLPTAAPAHLELLDVAGRRLRAIDVAGAGEHVERFERLSELPSGVYLVRLAQRDQVRVARVALLR